MSKNCFSSTLFGVSPGKTIPKSRYGNRLKPMASLHRTESEYKVKHDPDDGELLPNVAIGTISLTN
eukprot:5083562-Pleurochrysis_carterae.AAC.1